MSAAGITLAFIFVFIVVAAMYKQYANWRSAPWYSTFTVCFTWFICLSVVFLIPMDISSVSNLIYFINERERERERKIFFQLERKRRKEKKIKNWFLFYFKVFSKFSFCRSFSSFFLLSFHFFLNKPSLLYSLL